MLLCVFITKGEINMKWKFAIALLLLGLLLVGAFVAEAGRGPCKMCRCAGFRGDTWWCVVCNHPLNEHY